MVADTWHVARGPDGGRRPDRCGDPSRLERLDPLWDELFPAEQGRIVQSLVERVDIWMDGATIRLRMEELAGLAHDLGTIGAELRRAAA